MGKILLEIKNIRKQFDGVEVLEGINLSIEEGEFITFLGSSGCGKTTTLRIIAGQEGSKERDQDESQRDAQTGSAGGI